MRAWQLLAAGGVLVLTAWVVARVTAPWPLELAGRLRRRRVVVALCAVSTACSLTAVAFVLWP